jgi:hypothetical protein
MRIILITCYPLLLAARCLNWVLGRDPLRLRPPAVDSFWIERDQEASRASYFSEFSIAEGLGNRGMGGIACNVLLLLARFFAPRRSQPGEVYSPAVDREEGIPDEVYTLW